jgi:hypothetical protein
LIYWGTVLREPLHTAFHNTRTLRWVKTHVGWDLPIEMLNKWIKESVVSHVTEDYLKKFIRRINFTQRVKRQLETVQYVNRQPETEHLKQISTDKELIKKYLRENIGSDFATCTAHSDDDVLGLDLSSWGGKDHMRENTPWKQTERKMQDYREYVRTHLGRLCPWHHWR